MSHTPAPWQWIRNGCTLIHFEAAQSPHPWAGTEHHLERQVLAIDLPEFIDEDDKRLIAAAPELLAALKAVVAVLQKEALGTALNNHKYDAVGAQAHAAIQRAEGHS